MGRAWPPPPKHVADRPRPAIRTVRRIPPARSRPEPTRSHGWAASPSDGVGRSSSSGGRSCWSRSRWRHGSSVCSGPADSSSTTLSRPGPRPSSRPSWRRRRRRSSSSSTARPRLPGRRPSRRPRPRRSPRSRTLHMWSGSCPTRWRRGRSRWMATRRTTSSSCRSRPTTRRRHCRASASGSASRPASRSSSPAGRPSTATSSRCRSPTSSGARSCPCHLPRSRSCSCSDRSLPPRSRSSSVGRRSWWRWPRSS